MKVLVIQGPNINLLGRRETSLYGSVTMEQIHRELSAEAAGLGIALETFQSNHEGDLVDAIQGAPGDGVAAIIINPAAYTHTSIAIRDALLAADLPYYEVHISNIHAREPFRHASYLSDRAAGVVAGFGPVGYKLALLGLNHALRADQTEGSS